MAQNTPILGKIKSSESAASLDAKYGPYASKDAANAALGENGDDVITAGLTVGITQSDGSVKEFWYQPDGQGGLQLVEKQVAAQEETDPTVPAWAKAETKPSYTASEVGAIPSSEKGVAGGVATLGSDGKVPQSQLPSYVDDVLEYSNQSSFPATGESGKIYVALDTNKTYRWSGSAYVEISQSLALGETSSTAFAGDRGKAIEDKIPSGASSSNKLATASDLSGKVDKVANAQEDNFASFDANGGIKDSGCNEGSFIKGVKQNGTLITPEGGVVNVTVQDGLSAFEIAQQQGYTGTVDQWLASLKANIGAFQFITPTDTTAEAALTAIGSTYASAIGGVSPSQATLSIILLMNDSNNTKTMMIATQDDGNSGYEFIYAGNLQSAMPSNVLTEDDIVDNLNSTSTTKPLSANQGKVLNETVSNLENEVFQYVYLNNFDTYSNDIAELYLVAELTESIQNISLRDFSNTVYFRALPNNIFTCNIDLNTKENGVVYELKVSTTSDSENYPVGMLIAYIVFKDIEHFKANSTGSDTKYINLNRAKKLYLQPIIQNYLTLSDVDTIVEQELENYSVSEVKGGVMTDDTNQKLLQVKFGNNRCNPDTVISVAGGYIKRTTGESVGFNSNVGNGWTGFIPVSNNGLYCNKATASSAAGWAAYRLATQEEIDDTSITKFIVDGVKYVFSHGSGKTSEESKIYNYVSGDVYVRFTLSDTTDVMVNVGSVAMEYEPYSYGYMFNDDMISERTVTVDNIEPTEWKYLGNNLCNIDECTFTDRHYIDGASGDIGKNSNSSKGYTGFIPIDERGLYFNHSFVSGFTIGYAYYKADKSFLIGRYKNSQTNPVGGTNNYAVYVEGAKYVRFTFDGTSTPENVMVNVGSVAMEYEPYIGRTKVISKEILPDFAIDTEEKPTMIDGVEVVLPNEIVITKSDRLQIFYRDIITSFNPYNYEVVCSCSVGTPYPRYFEYKPDSNIVTPKSYSLSVRVYDNAHRQISSGSTYIRIVADATSPSTNKNIMLIGASTLANGEIVNELNRRFNTTTGDGTYYNPTGLGLNNISFVGRKTTSVAGVNQESQSGWQWKDYATVGRYAYRFFVVGQVGINVEPGAVYSGAGTLKFTVSDSDIDIDRITGNGYFTCTYDGSGTQPSSGTLTLYSGEGDATITYDSFNIDSGNPFWDDTNSQLDFTTYINTYCGGQLDFVVSYLGINDIFSSRTPYETRENYIKPFLRALHTQSPNTKVIICNLHIPSPYGGMGTSYGASSSTYWIKCAKYFDYIKALNELETDEEFSGWVSVCSSFQEFDGENLYPESTTRTMCNRSEKIGNVQTNGVHPTVSGKKAIADSIFHKITQKL